MVEIVLKEDGLKQHDFSPTWIRSSNFLRRFRGSLEKYSPEEAGLIFDILPATKDAKIWKTS